jgi:hypothetical protein
MEGGKKRCVFGGRDFAHTLLLLRAARLGEGGEENRTRGREGCGRGNFFLKREDRRFYKFMIQLPLIVKDSLTKELGGTFAGYAFDYIEKREEQGKENIYKIIVIKNKFPQEFYISESGKIEEKEAEEN